MLSPMPASRNASPFCALRTGAAIFHERFEGAEAVKDRYFLVITDASPAFDCFTTTTQSHADRIAGLSSEYCEILEGECVLPKRCFVDLRSVYAFDDIHLSSWLRSGRVRHLGDLPSEILARILSALKGSRALSRRKKAYLECFLNAALSGDADR